MLKQLKQDMNICQESKNEELNETQNAYQDTKIEFNKIYIIAEKMPKWNDARNAKKKKSVEWII